MRNNDKIHSDVLLGNDSEHIANKTPIGVIPEDGQNPLSIWIARMDAWLNSSIEELQRVLKVVGSGGKESHVLKDRYNALLLVTAANIQAECI